MTTPEREAFTTADAIVQELVREGVEYVFGIVSIHNMPIYDAVTREGSIRLITARGESGAVNMADGYARATGKLGVVVTSTGAGAGNTAGGLTEAWNAGVPLLHIAGDVASPYLGTGKRYIHECKDQLAMMDGASKKAYLLKNPAQTATVIRSAIEEAKAAPAGPITVNIPIDLQLAIIPESRMIDLETPAAHAASPADEIPLPEEIVRKIAQAKRPLIWAGGGVIAADASDEVKKLAEMTGAGVITSESGKGAIPEDHPQCIGHFAFYEATQELLRKSDLVISIGVLFRGNETHNWKLPFPEDHIGIDMDWQAFNLNYPVTYGLKGDAKRTLTQLLKALAEHEVTPDAAYVNEVKATRDEVRAALRKTLGPYEAFADGMRRILPKDAILVRDVTVPASLWGSRLIDIYEPRTSIHACGGGIGQGLPTAIGAQLGRKDRVVALMAGDGGFMLNVGELATAAQENLPIIVILFDDSGYGVLRGIQDAVYGKQMAVELMSPDFVKLGQSMGFTAEKVDSAAAFEAELEAAVKRRKPSMIVVDMEAVGPMAEPYRGSPAVIQAYRPKKM